MLKIDNTANLKTLFKIRNVIRNTGDMRDKDAELVLKAINRVGLILYTENGNVFLSDVGDPEAAMPASLRDVIGMTIRRLRTSGSSKGEIQRWKFNLDLLETMCQKEEEPEDSHVDYDRLFQENEPAPTKHSTPTAPQNTQTHSPLDRAAAIGGAKEKQPDYKMPAFVEEMPNSEIPTSHNEDSDLGMTMRYNKQQKTVQQPTVSTPSESSPEANGPQTNNSAAKSLWETILKQSNTYKTQNEQNKVETPTATNKSILDELRATQSEEALEEQMYNGIDNDNGKKDNVVKPNADKPNADKPASVNANKSEAQRPAEKNSDSANSAHEPSEEKSPAIEPATPNLSVESEEITTPQKEHKQLDTKEPTAVRSKNNEPIAKTSISENEQDNKKTLDEKSAELQYATSNGIRKLKPGKAIQKTEHPDSYEVSIIETYERTYVVRASNADEAIESVKTMWDAKTGKTGNQGILESKDFVRVNLIADKK